MKRIPTTKNIIILFYFLLFISFILLCDYFLFWYFSKFLSYKYLLLGIALSSSVFTFLILNNITDIIHILKLNVTKGKFLYHDFTLLLVTMCLGVLLIIPGFISTVIGLVLYLAPIRRTVAFFVYKVAEKQIKQWFSLFMSQLL